MTIIPLVIVGAGGHGRETALLIEQINAAQARFDLRGFLDDDSALHGTCVGGYQVLGPLAALSQMDANVQVALGIGDPTIKERVYESCLPSRTLPCLIHPTVGAGARVVMGEGTQVHAGVILTTDIRIGRAVTINRRVDISHDNIIDDFATLAPAVSLAGNVHVGARVSMGIKSSCLPGVRLGASSSIGAGAVVLRDIPAHTVAVGVPARVIRSFSPDSSTAP